MGDWFEGCVYGGSDGIEDEQVHANWVNLGLYGGRPQLDRLIPFRLDIEEIMHHPGPAILPRVYC